MKPHLKVLIIGDKNITSLTNETTLIYIRHIYNDCHCQCVEHSKCLTDESKSKMPRYW